MFLIIDRSIQGYRGVWVGRVRYEFRGAAAQELEDHLRLFDPECPARRCSSWTSFCSLNQGLFFGVTAECAHTPRNIFCLLYPAGRFQTIFMHDLRHRPGLETCVFPGSQGMDDT